MCVVCCVCECVCVSVCVCVCVCLRAVCMSVCFFGLGGFFVWVWGCGAGVRVLRFVLALSKGVLGAGRRFRRKGGSFSR